MILTENIDIKISPSNINHYRSKGYKCEVNDIINVNIEDLCKGNKEKIKVKCDVCGYEKIISYRFYYKRIYKDKYYSCHICAKEKVKKTNLERYGVENPMKNPEIYEKVKKTNLERYGVEYIFQLDETKAKYKETMLSRYGVEYPLQNDNIMNKFKETNLERYGEHKKQTQQTKDKVKKTNLKKYNVDNYSKTEECKEKVKKTNLKNYGVEYPIQNYEFCEKMKKTNLEKYGNIYYMQSDDFKEKSKNTNLKKFGVEHNSQNIEIKNKKIKTNLTNSGVEYPLQNLEIFNKVQKSAFKLKKYKEYYYRGTYELDFLINFSDNYKIGNVKSIDYVFDNKNKKYHPDFYLPDYNLIVEIKSRYIYDREKDKNEAKKEAAINSGYNFIFIIDKIYESFISIVT